MHEGFLCCDINIHVDHLYIHLLTYYFLHSQSILANLFYLFILTQTTQTKKYQSFTL